MRRINRRVFLTSLAALAAGAAFSGRQSWVSGGSIIPAETRALDELLAVPPAAQPCALPFRSFFLGGFECSTHRRFDGVRLDMTSASNHDRCLEADYKRLAETGLLSCRDGLSWIGVEKTAGKYDFSFARRMLHAGNRAGVDICWDIMHFGWPDEIEIFSTEFISRFTEYARAFASLLKAEGKPPHVICPINEISFLSWAGGDKGLISPFEEERGYELKVQLVRASLAAMKSIREELPDALFLHCEPLIHVAPRRFRFWEAENARMEARLQYQSWDLLSGCIWPGIAGTSDYLDIVGVNYYSNNQRFSQGRFLTGEDSSYMPLSSLLLQVWRRYQKPILISETGIEGRERPAWLRHVCNECVVAMRSGCPIVGMTWYPILNHPGWNDGRYCENGLWDYADESGHRRPFEPLAIEFKRLGAAMTSLRNSLFSGYFSCGLGRAFPRREDELLCVRQEHKRSTELRARNTRGVDRTFDINRWP